MKTILDILNFKLFTIKNIAITPFLILEMTAFVVVSWIVSKQLQKILKSKLLSRTHLDEGTQFTILRLIHYLICLLYTSPSPRD